MVLADAAKTDREKEVAGLSTPGPQIVGEKETKDAGVEGCTPEGKKMAAEKSSRVPGG